MSTTPTPPPPPIPDPGMDGVDDVTRAEMRRRLEDIAATTVLAPDAWESFDARRAATTPSKRWRQGPRALLAVAAAVVVVLGVALAVLRAGDREGGDIDMVGEGSTTTQETQRRPTTTTPTTGPGTSTSTSAVTDDSDSDGGGAAPPPSGPGAVTSTTIIDEPATAPQRAPAALTLTASGREYTVELVWDGETMFFRRTDDVGTAVEGPPDGYGHIESAGWGPVGAPGCLASSGQEYSFPDAATHAFTWGVMGYDIATVEVVMGDGTRTSARVGGTIAGGVRPWVTERPLGAVDRIEGRNSRGEVVATITELVNDWGSAGC